MPCGNGGGGSGAASAAHYASGRVSYCSQHGSSGKGKQQQHFTTTYDCP